RFSCNVPERHFDGRFGEIICGKCEPKLLGYSLDFQRVLVPQQWFEIRSNQMCARKLVLSAPSRRTRDFADACEALVRVDFNQQKRRDCVAPTAPAADSKFRFEGHADWNSFDP